MNSETALPPIVSAGDVPAAGDGVVIADVRWSLGGPKDAATFREEYATGHIPGAVFVDLDDDLSDHSVTGAGRHPLPREDDFAATRARLGIGADTRVYAYGTDDPAGAARLVLMLRFSGIAAALIDGGLPAYRAAHPDVPMEPGHNDPTPVETVEEPLVRLVSIDEVAYAAHSRNALLVDARAPERFRGDVEPVDPRAGHIPTAVNVPYAAHLQADGTFRSPEQIRRTFEDAGATGERIVINYCGSGVSACVNVLAMEHAGLRHGYLFPGSFSEWSADPQREVETR